MKSLYFQMTEQKTSKLKKIFFIAALFVNIILLSLVTNFPYELRFNVNVIKKEDPEFKTILLWNNFFTGFGTFGLRFKNYNLYNIYF